MLPNVIHFIKKNLTAAGRIDPRLGLLIFLILVVAVAASAFTPAQQLKPTPTPVITLSQEVQAGEALPSRTPLPPEFLANGQQTIGLTLAAAALVLVVVIGVLVTFLQRPVDI